MRHPIILAIFVLTSCGSDVVTTRFATVEDARSKGAFERRWLPPVLPDSARNIIETNNLDVNIGDGSFEFSPSDYTVLASRLRPARPEVVKDYWGSHVSKGFAIFTYGEDGVAFWTLALHPRGQGFYTVAARY
jgi:hypothetical protein